MPINRANQASGTITPSATASDGAVDFGFSAGLTILKNDGKEAYVTFRSTIATTGDFPLTSGDSITVDRLVNGFGAVGTSSGASTRYLALG